MGFTGKGMAEYAKGLVGTPYFYGAKIQYGKLTENFMKEMHNSYPNVVTNAYMQKARDKKQVGKVNVDCSGVIAGYRKKMLGSSQLYSTAKKRLPISEWREFAIGTVLWKSGHVGVYIGNGKVVEAKGINYGCIISNITDTPWKYGLTFSDIEYSYDKKVQGTSKGKNPYHMSEMLLRKGAKGDAVKWLQWELMESGYDLKIDGIFGEKTENALINFQKSCKIEADGICGPVSRGKLIAD